MINPDMITEEEYWYFLRHDFASFIQRSFYQLNPEAHLVMGSYIELIAAKLEECRTGKIKRLVINLPPRYLKSHCASIAFPAFILGHDPSAHIICVSYGQDLAEKLARDTRTLMTSALYKNVFPTRLAHDRYALHDFMTTGLGSRMATSVGGTLTGRGADIIILDDPQKPDEAQSETRRNTVNEWYDNTLLSRLNDKVRGCIVLVMQRIHQDDLVGHVLVQDGWDVLNLPAIATQDECFNFNGSFGPRTVYRREGELLLPERDDIETLQNIRQTIGEYNFQAQYQQQPSPPGGAMIKANWIKYYEPGEEPGQFDMVFQSWDTANKAGSLNDHSVCVTFGVKGNCLYLLDVFRRRLDFPGLKRAVSNLADRFRPSTIVIEDKASGTQLIQELQRELRYGIKAYEPGNADKIMRLYAQTAFIESGNFLVPKTAGWLQEYLKELYSFPGVTHDDQVDATIQALDWFQNGREYGFFDIKWIW